MPWIYLSPHFDDAALSCGGLAWEQAQCGEGVEIWTICAGEPPQAPLSPYAASLHERWGVGREAVVRRREEDEASCKVIGATPVRFHIPDCIYRQAPNGTPLYTTEEALFGPLHPLEAPLVARLAAELAQRLPEDVEILCPLALGGHVDHRLVREAACRTIREGTLRRLWFYADVPYVLRQSEALERLREKGYRRQVFPVTAAGLEAWQAAIAAHASQISSFWQDLESMRAAIRRYCEECGGATLWRTG